MNLSTQPRSLYKGTYVANLSKVDNVYGKNSQPKLIESLPAHLQDLYQRSVKELTTENAKAVKELLIKYSHLFAVNDADLGQTKNWHWYDITNKAAPKTATYSHGGKGRPSCGWHAKEEVNWRKLQSLVVPSFIVKKKNGTTRFCVDYRKLDKRHCQRCILSSEDRWFTVPVVRRKILLDFRLDFGLLASRSSRKVRSSQGKGFTVLRSCLSGFVMPQRRLNV